VTDVPTRPTAPILLIAFNRPDLLEQAIAPLDAVQPSKVFLALDGARAGREGEAAEVQACEDVVRTAAARWRDCELTVLRRNENLGMKRACVGAIDWFFSQVDAGIIIEDDCVADPTFFAYATELLSRYRDEATVMAVCGTNYVGAPEIAEGASYRFVRNFGVWGWATWARAWEHNDSDLLRSDRRDIANVLKRQTCSGIPRRRFWLRLLTACADGRNPNWDFPWTFSMWREESLCIHPDRNLVSNIGHDERATQTNVADARLSRLPTRPMGFPLQHPADVDHDCTFDRWSDRNIKGIGWMLELKVVVKRVLRALHLPDGS
jgi:hypothetical protein